MKVVTCFLLAYFSISVWSQAVNQSGSNELTDRIQRGHDVHVRSLRIVQMEQARARQPLCPEAMTTIAINECYAAELATTDANYRELVRLLGTLLAPGDMEKAAHATAGSPFEEAESAWRTYRDLACTAAGGQFAGGTIRPSIEMGCRLTVTRHHMDELWAVYSDLGTR